MKAIECISLEEVRSNINRIDESIIDLISQRSYFVNQAAHFKKTEQEVEAPKRVEQVLMKVRDLAISKNLNPDIAEAVYREMIRAFIDQEKNQLRGL